MDKQAFIYFVKVGTFRAVETPSETKLQSHQKNEWLPGQHQQPA